MSEIVKFRPEKIDEVTEGLYGLRDIIAPVLRRINGDGMGEPVLPGKKKARSA